MVALSEARVFELSSTTGTGDFTLAGAPTGFRAFSAVCTTGDVFRYVIEGVANGVQTGEWEVGVGTYSAANTLTRTAVEASSNAGAAVNFSAGTKRVSLLSDHPGQGASFPSSPVTGMRFRRTDREIEYFYDGTRWLSTQLFTLALQNSASQTATFAADIINPWASVYSIYITDFAFMSRQTAGTTSAHYFTCVLQNSSNPATPTAISGTLSAINNTLDLYEQERETTNAVVANTVTNFRFLFTETGTATAILGASITYRLVG